MATVQGWICGTENMGKSLKNRNKKPINSHLLWKLWWSSPLSLTITENVNVGLLIILPPINCILLHQIFKSTKWIKEAIQRLFGWWTQKLTNTMNKKSSERSGASGRTLTVFQEELLNTFHHTFFSGWTCSQKYPEHQIT